MATGTRDDAAQVPESDSDSDLIKCLDTPDRDKCEVDHVRITRLIKNWTDSPLNLPLLPIGTQVAKKMLKEQCSNDSDRKRLQQEYELLRTCRHEHIVSVFCISSCQPIFFVMEAGERSLHKFLHKSDHPTAVGDLSSSTGYTMGRCLVWLTQIADGLDYLHSKKIVHRDVKSGNVLLFDCGTVCKVCDLDISRWDNESTKTGNIGTGPYMAPEIKVNRRAKYSVKVDNYSFGVLMLECLRRECPTTCHIELPSESVFGTDMDKKYKFENLKKQMELLLSEEPKQRPDFNILTSRLLTKDEKKLLKLEPLTLPRVDKEVKMENVPKVPSAYRTGLTLYYSVRNPDRPERAAEISEKSRIAEFLNSRSHQIKRKNHPQDAQAKHSFSALDQIYPNEFCRIEHTIVCSNEEQQIFDYCKSNDQHIQWLKRKFQDEEGLENLEFTVSRDNPAAPTDNEE